MSSTTVAALVDTNVLVYRFDPRFPLKQEQATELLRRGIVDQSIVLPYQALVEFVAATTLPISGQASLLTKQEAHREVEDLLAQFQVIYPTDKPYARRSAARRCTRCLGSILSSGLMRTNGGSIRYGRKTSRTAACM